MRDARAVRDDPRRAGVGLGLAERLHRLLHVGAHRDARHLDVPVAQSLEPEVLLDGRDRLVSIEDCVGHRSPTYTRGRAGASRSFRSQRAIGE